MCPLLRSLDELRPWNVRLRRTYCDEANDALAEAGKRNVDSQLDRARTLEDRAEPDRIRSNSTEHNIRYPKAREYS